MALYHYVETFTNSAGDVLEGYPVKLYDINADAYATLYSDTSLTPIVSVSGIADAGLTNSKGRCSIYVDDGQYNVQIFDKVNTESLIDSIPAVPMLSGAESFTIAATAEQIDATTGTAVVSFRMPHAFNLSAVRASCSEAPTGAAIQVDINESGVSILDTEITIDAGEKTSTTAAVPAVLSDTALADDAEITIDIDQVGSTTAGKGIKVTLIGLRD